MTLAKEFVRPLHDTNCNTSYRLSKVFAGSTNIIEYGDVLKTRGTPKSSLFSMVIFHDKPKHRFWGYPPIYGNLQMFIVLVIFWATRFQYSSCHDSVCDMCEHNGEAVKPSKCQFPGCQHVKVGGLRQEINSLKHV